MTKPVRNIFRFFLLLATWQAWPSQSFAQLPDDLTTVFDYGEQRGLAGPYQRELLNALWRSQTESQRAALRQLLTAAGLPLVRFFLLESYLAGHSYTELQTYLNETRAYGETEIFSRSTMRDPTDLIQQWNDACSTALVQTALGEGDPIFAWQLNKLGDLTDQNPYGSARAVAAQQKEWLEKHGGRAVARGQTDGVAIGINSPLNDYYGAMLGLTYRAEAAANTTAWYQYIAQLTGQGFLVPIRIEWSAAGGTAVAHFVLVLNASASAGQRSFLIHDTWTGHTAWVAESSLLQHSIAPVNASFSMTLTHVYVPTPQDVSWLAGRFRNWGSEVASQAGTSIQTQQTQTTASISSERAEVLVQNGQWLPARILQTREDYFYIHFEGYDTSHD